MKDAAIALRRLADRGLITSDDTRLTIAYDLFRQSARERAVPTAVQDHGSGDEQVEAVLRTFVREGRLVRLPAQWTRKKVVLRYIAEQTFEPGVDYPERAVNEKLRAWCVGGLLDHVALRRYLVDLGHLRRDDGVYWRPAEDTVPV
ncbi:DUF2087 domain-containing protein [Streptomyces sp. NPDC052051]|uniref:DUF2087 domain-containing protein n=1 Tax=Streptomyces sp. NPDC052051 TaxID=3154649 RepID=UPI003413198C